MEPVPTLKGRVKARVQCWSGTLKHLQRGQVEADLARGSSMLIKVFTKEKATVGSDLYIPQLKSVGSY